MGTARIDNRPTVSTPFVSYSIPNTNPVAAGGKLGTANHIAVFPFNLPYPMLVTNMVFTVGTAGGAASNYDIGIYSISGSTGTLVAHIGAQILNTTGTQILPVTAPVTLQAGTYLIAITGVATTLGIRTPPVIGGAGTMYVYDTSTTSTGGALPSSIALINTTPTDVNLPAAAQWSFSGSPPPLFMLT